MNKPEIEIVVGRISQKRLERLREKQWRTMRRRRTRRIFKDKIISLLLYIYYRLL